MKKLGVLLPGNIGDVIICLPIAKWYAEKGYTIIWPLYDFIFSNFKDATDYVTFKSIPIANCVDVIRKEFLKLNCEVLDLSFTSPYTWQNANTKEYLQQSRYSFDEFRYKLANVPFDEKWNLKLNRNYNREQQLYDQLITNSKYTVIQTKSSDVCINLKLDSTQYTGQLVNIHPVTDCIFDWLTILQNAEGLVLIESCFTNLVDQLSIKNRKQLLLSKPNYYRELIDNNTRRRGFPVLKNNWQIL